MSVIYYDLASLTKHIPANKRIVIISDTNVAPLHAEKVKTILQEYSVELLTMPAGEIHKSRATKAMLEDQLLEKGYKRDLLLIALGGGVVTDLVGYIAATYCRGVSVLYIPTSMMAMVDAAIGGKTGINTSYGKNMLGCIRLPEAIFIDVAFLYTLPDTEYLYAYAEVIKHALIGDCAYFEYLEQNVVGILARKPEVMEHIIKVSNKIKLDIVALDLYDKGQRAILNYGHKYGHAIEIISGYKIPHGRAVACGLLLEPQLNLKISKSRLEQLMQSLRIDHTCPYSLEELKPYALRSKL